MDLIRPLRLFLDTNHLVNLTHLRQGWPLRGGQDKDRVRAYQSIDEWLRSGRCVPVFCETMAYEWVRQKDVAAPGQIAAIFDSAAGKKRVPAETLIFVLETMDECQRIEPKIGYPGLEIVRELGPDVDFVRWCNENVPVRDGLPIRKHGGRPGAKSDVAAIVDLIADDFGRGRDLWRQLLEAEQFRLRQTQELQCEQGTSDKTLNKLKERWAREVLLADRILRGMAPHLDPEEILRRLRIDRCLSLNLHIDAHWAYARGGRQFDENDLVDLTMLAVLPHTDLALIEGGIHDLVRQVRGTEYADRVFRDPVDLVGNVSARS